MDSWLSMRENIFNNLDSHEGIVNNEFLQNLHEDTEIVDFLATLHLLHIPLLYLPITEHYLQPESLRYFQVDKSWIAHLIDGVMSVGRSSSSDIAFDKVNYNFVFEKSAKKCAKIRQNILTRQNIKSHIKNEEVKHISGFFLRSRLVADYPTLKYSVVGKGEALDILRLEKISPDIIMCLVNGIADSVSIREATEILPFVFEERQGKIVKIIHSLANSEKYTIGDDLHKNCVIPMRDGSKRVINVKKLAEDMEDILRKEKAIADKSPFTSAELALQLISTKEVKNMFRESAGSKKRTYKKVSDD